jgi:hypothetical protein
LKAISVVANKKPTRRRPKSLKPVFTKSAKMGHFLHFVIFRAADNETIKRLQCPASGGGVNT